MNIFNYSILRPTQPDFYSAWSRRKIYELSNHLENVLSTVIDKKVLFDNNNDNAVDLSVPEIATANDYYPFGMLMPGRTLSTEDYRFGFNGQENLDDIKGVGKTVDFGSRSYDSRIGKWLRVDAYFNKYANLSPYSSFENNPIVVMDLNGDTTVYFSQSGKHLFTSIDKLPTAVTIVSDKYLKVFAIGLHSSFKNKTQNDNFKNLQSRSLGKTFDINAFRSFYNSNTIVGVDNISPQSKTGFNDPGYFNESRSYIYEKNNLLRPGNNVAKGFIDWVSAYPEKEEGIGEITGKAHTHPNEGENGGIGPYEFGPSPDDLDHKWVNDVIVGSKNIYFYGKNNTEFGIDKSTLKPIKDENK